VIANAASIRGAMAFALNSSTLNDTSPEAFRRVRVLQQPFADLGNLCIADDGHCRAKLIAGTRGPLGQKTQAEHAN
jgi:hypothetical protein